MFFTLCFRPVGWVPSAQKWLPANPPPTDLVLVNVTNDMIAERGSSTFTDYLGGIGGPCSHFTPPFSYWCSLAPSGGGGFQYYLPSGMTWSPGTFPDGVDFSNTSKAEQQRAVFQVWRRSHWARHVYTLDLYIYYICCRGIKCKPCTRFLRCIF